MFFYVFIFIEQLIVCLSHCSREDVKEELCAEVCHYSEDETRRDHALSLEIREVFRNTTCPKLHNRFIV